MYYVINKSTGHNMHYSNIGRVKKAYAFRVLAEKATEESDTQKSQRVDVVEISRSSMIKLQNQKK